MFLFSSFLCFWLNCCFSDVCGGNPFRGIRYGYGNLFWRKPMLYNLFWRMKPGAFHEKAHDVCCNHNKCTRPMFWMRQKHIFKFKLISVEEYSSCLLNLMMAWGSPIDFSGFIPSARETPSPISGNKQYGEMPCLSANFQFRWWSFCFDIRPSCRWVDNFLELDDPYFLYFWFWA